MTGMKHCHAGYVITTIQFLLRKPHDFHGTNEWPFSNSADSKVGVSLRIILRKGVLE